MATSTNLEKDEQKKTSSDNDSLSLKEFLEDVLKDKDAIKKDFDELSVYSQSIRQVLDSDGYESDDDDTVSEGRIHKYQEEKHRLDSRISDLESKLVEKQRIMSDLENQASDYLKQAASCTNNLLPAEEQNVDEKKDTEASGEESRDDLSEHKTEGRDKGEGCILNDKGVSSVDVEDKSSGSPEGPSLASDNPEDQMKCLSSLVSDLRKVKNEMGKCMSHKEKSFVDIQKELSDAKQQQNTLKKEINSVKAQLDEKDENYQTVTKENEIIKRDLKKQCGQLLKATSESMELLKGKEELENKLRVLEVMMTEYRAEIETVTGEKTQVEEHAKQIEKEMSSVSERLSFEQNVKTNITDEIVVKYNNSSSRPKSLNLDDLHKSEIDQNMSMILKENRKLNEKLKSTSNYLRTLAKDSELKREECASLQEKVQQVEGKMMQVQTTFDTLVSAVMAERDELVKDCAQKSVEINRLSELLMQLQLKEKNLSDEITKLYQNEVLIKGSLSSLENKLKTADEKLEYANRSHKDQLISIKTENENRENEQKNKIDILQSCQDSLEKEVEHLKEDAKNIANKNNELLASLVPVETFREKENECAALKEDIANSKIANSEFANSLKEEMNSMKEDMTKLGNTRLQLEVANDALTEENQDLLRDKERLEDSCKHLKETSLEAAEKIGTLESQLSEVNLRNTSLNDEHKEKLIELNEELTAREATIQELRITLTNNQKQSAENYRALQEDMTIMQLKFSKQGEEEKNNTSDLENKLEETVRENEQFKKSINELTSENANHLENVNSLRLQIDETLKKASQENDLDEIDAKPFGRTATDEMDCKKDFVIQSHLTRNESEVKLNSMKEEALRLQEEMQCSRSDESTATENKIKIARVVRLIKELSELLAVTKVTHETKALVSTESSTDDSRHDKGLQTGIITSVQSVGTSKEHILEDKGTATWKTFASQKEFEEFVYEKTSANADLESKVKTLEISLSTKNLCENNDEQCEELNEDADEISKDIDHLKKILECSQTELSDLRNTVGRSTSEHESEKIKLVMKIGDKVVQSLPSSDDDGINSGNECEEIKKNLDEQMNHTLNLISSKILFCFHNKEKINNNKIVDIESSYKEKIFGIKNEYDQRILTLLESAKPLNQSVYFSEKIRILEDNIDRLREIVLEMEGNKSNIQERMKVSESKVGILNEVKRKLMDYSKSLEEKLYSTDKHFLQTHDEKSNIEKQISKLTSENSELKNIVQSLNEQIDAMVLQSLERNHFVTENSNFQLKLKEKICSYEEDLSKIKSSLDSCMHERDVCVKDKESLLKQNNCIQSKLEDLNKQIELLNKEKSVTDTLNKELSENLLAKESSCISDNFKCEELFQINESLKSDIENLQKQVSCLVEEKENLQKEILNFKNSSNDMERSNEPLKHLLVESPILDMNIVEEGENAVDVLNTEIKKLVEEKDSMCKRYEEDQKRLLEMQNLMVSDMEKLILNLETEKKSLETQVKLLVQEKQISEESSTTGKIDCIGGNSENSNSSIDSTVMDQLLHQIKELQKKLTVAQEDLIRKDMEYQEKMNAEKGGNTIKLHNLREDLKEEIDILETRKEEETDELCEKFSHLEVEFTSKLAEMKEYYESLLAEEKADFGRMLVMRVDEYEKKIAEKCDVILGWETRLASMQQELYNKSIVIEELEERLDDNFDAKGDVHNFNFTPILSPSKDKRHNLQVSRSLDISLSDVDIPSNIDRVQSSEVHKPILSLVIPSTFNDEATSSSVIEEDSNIICTSPPNITREISKSISPVHSAFTRVTGKSTSMHPVRTAVFVSRDFPTDAALQSSTSSHSIAQSTSESLSPSVEKMEGKTNDAVSTSPEKVKNPFSEIESTDHMEVKNLSGEPPFDNSEDVESLSFEHSSTDRKDDVDPSSVIERPFINPKEIEDLASEHPSNTIEAVENVSDEHPTFIPEKVEEPSVITESSPSITECQTETRGYEQPLSSPSSEQSLNQGSIPAGRSLEDNEPSNVNNVENSGPAEMKLHAAEVSSVIFPPTDSS